MSDDRKTAVFLVTSSAETFQIVFFGREMFGRHDVIRKPVSGSSFWFDPETRDQIKTMKISTQYKSFSLV
jgi:hypothetical protein